MLGWGSGWEMLIPLSCYNKLMFCFNLTVLNLDWSLGTPFPRVYVGCSHLSLSLSDISKQLLKTNRWHRIPWRQQEYLVALSYSKISEKFSIAQELKKGNVKSNGVWSLVRGFAVMKENTDKVIWTVLLYIS